MEKKSFVTETGLKSTIKIKKCKKITEDKKKYTGVKIDVNNNQQEISLVEAIELYNTLGAFLKKNL